MRPGVPDDSHLTRDYYTTKLGEVMSEGGLTCFE